MRENGIVKSVCGNTCTVAVKRKTACGENCASCGANCAGGVHICECKNGMGAAPGDRVVIESDTGSILKAAFLIYILPLLCFFIPYAIADACGTDAVLSVFAALLCTSAAVIYSVMYSKKHKSDFLPNIVKII